MALSAPVTWRDEEEHRRILANVVNNTLDGRTNNVGSVTLTASTTSTTVNDKRVGVDSVIVFTATTSNAAKEIATGNLWVSSRGKQTFTISHSSNAQTDKDFEYAIIGTGRGT